jgi:serine/threonine-protein kinase
VLDTQCSGDVDLRRRVEALLDAHEQFDGSLDVPLAGIRSDAPTVTETDRQDGESIPDDSLATRATATDSTGGPEPNVTVGIGAPGGAREPSTRAVPVISGYEVLGELGRGGMGVVYRARQTRLNRPCVLKMILAGVHADAEASLRFLAEAEAVARLRHANIVQIHHIGEADGLPFFELEYVEGGSLDRRLDGTPWPAKRAAELVGALALGVAAAHRQGIIHRDLKPGNVLLEGDGTPKITDFGLAKSLDSGSGVTRSDAILGSPAYMAPEQAEGKARHVGPLADVYALGAILYELLTGRPPFVGTTVLETLEQVKTVDPVPPSRLVPGLSRDVETIALKCLQKEPAKRYESAMTLAEDLERFLAGEPIVARPVPSWERAWRWCRHNPAVAGLATTLATILLTATAASLIAYERMSRLARDEHDARLAAEDARAKEASQRERAETNFNRARAAVDGYLTKVSESQLLKVTGLQPLRRELLESALPFYADFVTERGDDSTLRAELAATHYRIGRIQTELGAADDARKALRSAIAAYQTELNNNPEDLASRAALADTWLALGDVADNLGGDNRGPDMLAAYEKTVEIREGLAHDHPDDLGCQKELAVAYSRLGIAQSAVGRDAMDAMSRSADIRQALILKSPDDAALNYAMGESLLNFATFLMWQGRHAAAMAMFVRSQEYYRFAYGKLPSMIEYGVDLGTAFRRTGEAYNSLGRTKEAIAEERKGVEHLQRMARDHPAVPRVKWRLRAAWQQLGDLLAGTGHTNEAARTRRDLARWLDVHADDAEAILDAARWHARLSNPARQGHSPPTNQEQAEAGRDADRAVEQLQRAIESGFADLNAIRTQKDLDTLRGREDFKLLVASLEQKVGRRTASTTATSTPSRAERVFRARVDRAASLAAVGVLYRGKSRPDEARVALDEARVLCQLLLKERPGDAKVRATLTETHSALAGLEWDAGRADTAIAHFDAAVAATPDHAEARLARGEALAALGRHGEAVADFSKVISLAPQNSTNCRMVAAIYARLARWDMAAETIAKLPEQKSDDHWNWVLAAVVSARAGDPDPYRRLCRRMLDRFGGTNDPEIAERTAKSSLLLSLSGPEQKEAGRLAERAVATATGGVQPWALAAKGLAEYRLERFADALVTIQKSQATMGESAPWLRTGHRDAAREALNKATALYRSNRPRTLPPEPGPSWIDPLICEVLLREAETLILYDPSFPANPFAP